MNAQRVNNGSKNSSDLLNRSGPRMMSRGCAKLLQPTYEAMSSTENPKVLRLIAKPVRKLCGVSPECRSAARRWERRRLLTTEPINGWSDTYFWPAEARKTYPGCREVAPYFDSSPNNTGTKRQSRCKERELVIAGTVVCRHHHLSESFQTRNWGENHAPPVTGKQNVFPIYPDPMLGRPWKDRWRKKAMSRTSKYRWIGDLAGSAKWENRYWSSRGSLTGSKGMAISSHL